MRSVILKNSFVLFLFLIGVNGVSKNIDFHFENYSDSEYMYLSSVRCITQDSLGFMWFGTSDGLLRFDGLTFDLYQNEKENTKSLVSNMIFSIDYDFYLDELVMGAGYMNLSLFDVNTLKTKNIRVDRSILDKPIGSSSVQHIVRVDSAVYMIGTDKFGLIKYHLPSQSWAVVKDATDNSPWGTNCTCLYWDNDFVWAGTTHGIVRVSPDLQFVEWYDLSSSFERNAIVSITDWDAENLLVSLMDGMYLFNKVSGTLNSAKISHPLMFDILKHVEDAYGNIWIASKSQGLFFYNVSDDQVTHYEAQPGNKEGLIHNVINDIYFSKSQDILWIGTHKGISKIDYNRTKFRAYNVGQLSDSNVENLFFLYKDTEQGYWFWDTSGLYHKARSDEHFKSMQIRGRQKVHVITGAAPLGQGRHLFTSVDDVFLFDPQKQDLQVVGSVLFGELDVSRYAFYGLTTDDNGKIWMSHRHGIVTLNPLSGENHYYPFPLKYQQGAGIVVTGIAVNNIRKEVWVGSKSGYLIRYDMVTEKFTLFNSSLRNSSEFSTSVPILELAFDNQNRLWAATIGSGLLLFDDDKLEYDDTYSFGPLKSTIYSLEKDQDGFFWIANNYGIVCFNPESGEYQFYDSSEGTFCHEFNERANHQGVDGEILLGGVGGFVTFYPEQVKKEKYMPRVVIKSMSLLDVSGEHQTYLTNTIDGEKQIEVSASRHPMHFMTAVLDHNMPKKNAILWKLEGYSDVWHESPVEEPIVFTNLVAGRYVLHVKEKISLSKRAARQDSVRLIILAPFYQHWWFRALVVLVLIILSYLVYWLRLQVFKRHNERLKDSVNEKTMELQIMNEELKESREEVLAQNDELSMHRNYLEDLVGVRTRDMQRAMLEAEEANRLKTAFLANLSHEVRTPMNAIIGFSSILVEDDFDSVTRRDLLSRILDNGESLLALIEDIVDISSIESGQEKLEIQKVVVGEFVTSFYKNLFFKDKSAEVELKLELKPNSEQCVLQTDPRRLKQVLNNLLNNAVKFTNRGFVILEVCRGSKDDLPDKIKKEFTDLNTSVLLFSVQDSGIGINSDNQELIFNPFWKVSDMSTDIYRGMGLGLNIVKTLINMLGGDIWVESVEGEGTVFSFFLPCHLHSK